MDAFLIWRVILRYAPPVTPHWLDAVLSAPTVGVLLAAPPSASRSAFREVGPFLDHMHKEFGDLRITETTSEFAVHTTDGFVCRLSHDESGLNSVVQFSFSTVESKSPGKLPRIGFASSELGTNELLQRAIARHRKLFALVPPLSQCAVRRLGLNIRSRLSADQMPPGVQRFKDALEAPWTESATLIGSNTTLLARIRHRSSQERWDQCHHGLDFDMDAEPVEFRTTLDYQRVWKTPVRSTEALSTLDDFTKTALQYMQDFGFSETPWPPR